MANAPPVKRGIMPRKRLTNNSDETELASLFSGETVFSIPYFQRAYKWKPERLHQLERDLLELVDESSDFHFLGAIIVHGRRSNPSDPTVFEVIDGQQRITTIYLYLCAIARALCKRGEYVEAKALFLKYLVIARETSLPSNSKLHLGKDDRAQLNFVLNDLMADSEFAKQVSPFKYKELPSTGQLKGRLRSNYRNAVRFFDNQADSEGISRLMDLYKSLLDSMSVVQIDVWDPINGPKIFDSLNSRQEPMTTGDLVRNEIFGKIASADPQTIEEIDQRSWQPFYSRFRENGDDLFDSYFFPYGLILDQNVRKSDVYSLLRERWRATDDPEAIISGLSEYQYAFLDIVRGSNLQKHSPEVQRLFKLLHDSRLPGSTYPFLMQLSNSLKEGIVKVRDGVAVLEVIESFLVRRAICGHEPTGLHAVFKRLWSDCNGSISAEVVKEKIQDHKTVVWPSNDDLISAVSSRPLYGSSITPYLLMEWNRSLGGDQPGTISWIEHVLPETANEGWLESFSRENHRKMKDLLANLLPLSQQMNQTLSNRPYAEKRHTYQQDSAFKAARKFADTYREWTPERLEKRSKDLASWAVARWKF